MTIEQQRAEFEKSGCHFADDKVRTETNWFVWNDAWQAAIASVSAQPKNWGNNTKHLTELIGLYSAEIASTGNMAPSTELINELKRIDNLLESVSAQPVELTDEELVEVLLATASKHVFCQSRAVLAAQRAKDKGAV